MKASIGIALVCVLATAFLAGCEEEAPVWATDYGCHLDPQAVSGLEKSMDTLTRMREDNLLSDDELAQLRKLLVDYIGKNPNDNLGRSLTYADTKTSQLNRQIREVNQLLKDGILTEEESKNLRGKILDKYNLEG